MNFYFLLYQFHLPPGKIILYGAPLAHCVYLYLCMYILYFYLPLCTAVDRKMIFKCLMVLFYSSCVCVSSPQFVVLFLVHIQYVVCVSLRIVSEKYVYESSWKQLVAFIAYKFLTIYLGWFVYNKHMQVENNIIPCLFVDYFYFAVWKFIHLM